MITDQGVAYDPSRWQRAADEKGILRWLPVDEKSPEEVIDWSLVTPALNEITYAPVDFSVYRHDYSIEQLTDLSIDVSICEKLTDFAKLTSKVPIGSLLNDSFSPLVEWVKEEVKEEVKVKEEGLFSGMHLYVDVPDGPRFYNSYNRQWYPILGLDLSLVPADALAVFPPHWKGALELAPLSSALAPASAPLAPAPAPAPPALASAPLAPALSTDAFLDSLFKSGAFTSQAVQAQAPAQAQVAPDDFLGSLFKSSQVVKAPEVAPDDFIGSLFKSGTGNGLNKPKSFNFDWNFS